MGGLNGMKAYQRYFNMFVPPSVPDSPAKMLIMFEK